MTEKPSTDRPYGMPVRIRTPTYQKLQIMASDHELTMTTTLDMLIAGWALSGERVKRRALRSVEHEQKRGGK